MQSVVARPQPPRTTTSSVAGRGVLVALAGYAAVRAAGVLALWLALDRSWAQVWSTLTTSYDAEHLLGIASNGYDQGLGRRSNLAFFPLFPLATRWLAHMAGDTIDISASGLLISTVAGLACAAALYAICRELGRPDSGVMLAVLWGALPHAITQSMAYTETLFTACAAWALYALLRQNWLLTGALTALAGLARTTASALIAVVVLAAAMELFRRRGRGWRVWVGAGIAPLGWLGYLWWVAERSVEPGGWFGVQQRWGSEFDGGAYSLGFFVQTLAGTQTLQMVVVSCVLAAATALIALSLNDRLRWELVAYGTLIVGLTVATAGFYQSKARLIVPAFTLLIPLATQLTRASGVVRVVLLGAIASVSAWYGTYLMIDAPRSP